MEPATHILGKAWELVKRESTGSPEEVEPRGGKNCVHLGPGQPLLPQLTRAPACSQGTDGVEPKETAPLEGDQQQGDERVPPPRFRPRYRR